MEYIKILEKEMQEVLEQIKPHFKGEKVYIKENYIILKRGGFEYCLVSFNGDGINNTNDVFYRNLNLDMTNIFEEVGEDLKELKIKPVPKFDINEWKKDFVERNNLALRIENGIVYRGNRKIINKDNDVNWSAWHNNIFEIKHKLFKFDSCDSFYLKTKEECEEFERVYKIMDKYLKNIPDLNKG